MINFWQATLSSDNQGKMFNIQIYCMVFLIYKMYFLVYYKIISSFVVFSYRFLVQIDNQAFYYEINLKCGTTCVHVVGHATNQQTLDCCYYLALKRSKISYKLITHL